MPASGKKKKKGSGSLALGAEDTGSAGGSKGSEEASFGDDVENPMSSKSIFLNDKIADFQQQHPDTFEVITAMFSDEPSMMVVISAYENYENKVEFDDLLSLNADVVREMIANGRFSKPAFQGLYRALPSVKDLGYTNDGGPNPKEVAIVEEHIKKPTKEVIRKKFERPKGGSMLLNRWTVAHTHVFEDLVADALDGTGLNAAEILHLNVDGACFSNAIVPVQGDSVASSAVLKGSRGRFFGDLKYTSKQSNQVVGAAPLKITELSGKVLQFPYYLDSKNPLSETEFAALNFFNEIFAGCLSMNDSVLTRDYMTMAAKFAIAQECILSILRTTCQLIYELDNQASWANILASQGLSGSNLRENPNVYAYTTPTMLAARAKYPYLDRGTYAIGCFMESLRNARGKEQMQPLLDLYTFQYSGQGASQFALQLQQLCLNAQSTVPALPKSKAEMHHPGVTDECGVQLFVYKLDESLHENRSQFQPSEFQAVQNLKESHAAGKLSSFASVLSWSKKTEDDGALRPSPVPLGGRASGFLSQNSHDHDYTVLSPLSPDEYTKAVDYVASLLTPDQFATYFERCAAIAQGYEYRLKSDGSKGGVIYVQPRDLAFDKRGKSSISVLRRALFFRMHGNPNPVYNEMVAQAKKIEFKCHPSCKQQSKSGSGEPAFKSDGSKVQFKLPPKPPPTSHSSGSGSSMSKSLRKRNKAKVQLAQFKLAADEAQKTSQNARDGACAAAKDASAFVARLASLEKSLAELQAPPSGSAMSATQASGPARKSTDEVLADIQSVLASQQAQLNQLTEEQPSMFSGFRFGDVGSNE